MAAVHDLRGFIDLLKQNGQLLHIQDEVTLEPDLAAAANALHQLGKENMPALYFDKIKGYNSARVFTNGHGSWPNEALILGMAKDADPQSQFFEFCKRYEKYPGDLEYRDDPPWKENVLDKDINLFELMPLFRLNRGDGGYYLDKCCIVTRDPDDFEHAQNVGMYRLEVKGPAKLGIQMVPEHDIAVHYSHAEERDEDLPIYICVGCSPIMEIVAAMPILYTQNEEQMASVLMGEPARVVKMPSGHVVPWGAEYVLEGKVKTRYREAEGPFGEFTGHYSGMKAMPVVEISKVYHRNDPIYESLYLGIPWTEIDYMIAINTAAPIYAQLKQSFPEVQSVNAMYTHGLVVIISTKRKVGGFARTVGMSCLTTPHGQGYAKIVIMVDEDVNPYDLKQVMWALSTKVNPKDCVTIIPELSILPLDPASEPEGMSAKMIIDATTPVAPDKRGNFSAQLDWPDGTDVWIKKLTQLLGKKD